MTLTTTSLLRRRKPWGSAVLSLVTPGLGHLYAGAPAAALVVFILCVLILAASAAAGVFAPWAPFNILLMLAGFVAAFVGAAYSAHRFARRAPPDYRLQRRYLLGSADTGTYRPTRDNWGPIVVPPEAFFVLGDNRDNSYDSRYFGLVPRRRLIGSLTRIYFSFDPDSPKPLPYFTAIRWRRIGQPVS